MENRDYSLFTTAELQKKLMDINNNYTAVKSKIMEEINQLDSLDADYRACESELRKRNYV